jgi:hypothetical protein
MRTGDRHKLVHDMKYNGKNRGTVAWQWQVLHQRARSAVFVENGN